MTFGYLGYIWALMGCGGLAMVFALSAAVLYGWSRRTRSGAPQPNIRVDSLPLPARDPDDAA
jgi:hypothetical protein